MDLELLDCFWKEKLCLITEEIRYTCILGTQFLYTTHGWTVISAVVEGAAKTSFEKCIKKLFKDLGMDSTFLEENKPLIYNRGRY